MSSPASLSPRLRPRQHLGALAQLAAVGAVGTAVLTVLATLFGVGLGLTPVLGVGILLLIAFLYGLWATSWIEHERIEGLYGFGVPTLGLRTSGRPGFGGWMRTLWRQFIDPRMWRGIASVAISAVLGLVVLGLVSMVVTSVGLLLPPYGARESALSALFDDRRHLLGVGVPEEWALAAGIVAIVVGLALLVGIALLHATLTRAILVPSREAQLAEQARAAGAQRAGAVRASEVERTRIERDLHDGVQPRLVSLAMTLGLAQQKIDTDPAAAKALIDEAHTSTKAAITELRQLARGIHASVLDDRGLDAALSALAARSPVPVRLDVRLDGRCSRTAEAAVYFAIAESLTNAAKHSRGSEARVTVRVRGGADAGGAADAASAAGAAGAVSAAGAAGSAVSPGGGAPDERLLWARVEDDGIGGARVLPGGGLDGIANRIAAAGGTFRLDSPNGGPTALEVSVPCAS